MVKLLLLRHVIVIELMYGKVTIIASCNSNRVNVW